MRIQQQNQRWTRPWAGRALGLTLVELLVVIGIIGVLLGLLIPTLARVKAAAKSASCRGNVRQLTLTLRLYVEDESCYPLFAVWTNDKWVFWTESLAPFLSQRVYGEQAPSGGLTTFECPSSLRAKPSQVRKPVTYGYSNEGYAFQGLGSKGIEMFGTVRTVAVQEHDVLQPSGMIALGDGIACLNTGLLLSTGTSLERWRLYQPVPSRGDPLSSHEQLQSGDTYLRRLHSGRANIGFCDGHVAAEKLSLLFNERGDGALRLWNRDHEPHREWLIP